MNTIISDNELQKNIGGYLKSNDNKSYIILEKGKPKMVLLPYFQNNDDLIDDYLELYEIEKNKKKIKAGLKASLKSGKSDLII